MARVANHPARKTCAAMELVVVFAVHSGDENSPADRHQLGQGFRAAEQDFTRPHRLVESRIALLDGRRIDHDLGLPHEFGGVRAMENESLALETADLRRIDLVGPADLVTEREQETGETTHAGTGYPDEVDALRRDPAQAGGVRVLLAHGWHRFSRVSTTLEAASAGDSRRACALIAVSFSGFCTTSNTVLASKSPLASVSRRARAAPACVKIRAFNVWWSSAAAGKGMSTTRQTKKCQLA